MLKKESILIVRRCKKTSGDAVYEFFYINSYSETIHNFKILSQFGLKTVLTQNRQHCKPSSIKFEVKFIYRLQAAILLVFLNFCILIISYCQETLNVQCTEGMTVFSSCRVLRAVCTQKSLSTVDQVTETLYCRKYKSCLNSR